MDHITCMLAGYSPTIFSYVIVTARCSTTFSYQQFTYFIHTKEADQIMSTLEKNITFKIGADFIKQYDHK